MINVFELFKIGIGLLSSCTVGPMTAASEQGRILAEWRNRYDKKSEPKK